MKPKKPSAPVSVLDSPAPSPAPPPTPTPTPTPTPAIADTGTTKPATKPKKNSNEVKWGKANMEAGWTCIPNILIRRQNTLGIDSIDLNILLHLLTYWWEDENLPHPSKDTLAKAMNVSASTIQRRIRSMEAGKLLKRIIRPKSGERNDTNLYDLTPLRAILEPHAKVELDERQAGRDGRRNRATKVAKIPNQSTPSAPPATN